MRWLVGLIGGLLFLFSGNSNWAAERRSMTVDDLLHFQRVSDPQISPDGRWVVCVVSRVDRQVNRISSNLWLLSRTPGGGPKQLTSITKIPRSDRHPRWSPDSKHILFGSNRSGNNQLWVIDIDGGEARQLTSFATEASDGIWSPNGRAIACVSAVWPEYSEKPFAESNALNQKRIEEGAKNFVKARVFTKLFYRHWDEWIEDKRNHLFVMSFQDGKAGEPRDVTPGDRDAYPTSSTFAAGDDFTFSPDGTFLVYTASPARHEAWSTNYDLWRVPVAGGQAECLTQNNPAADGFPRFSPDGKWLAYRAQERPGFEADRWQILLIDARNPGKPRSLTAALDASPSSFVWSHDSKTIFFDVEIKASVPIHAVEVATGVRREVIAGNSHSSLSLAGNTLAFSRAALHHPPEVFIAGTEGNRATPLSSFNAGSLDQLDMPRPESVQVAGADGTPMQMWILKPPGFDSQKKWPLVFLVHGGPQGAWEDSWSYRWNPELWAAQGYVVALPNPRGSTGFGQKYTDEISRDWGGKCFEDLMAGVSHLEKLPYIDSERMAAAGASFGGYMMNWFQGHTTKFKTLITHCGVYNFDSMFATDELWFYEWEHGGPPWSKDHEACLRHSPHRYSKNFKTPMLIIHNDYDFRCPVSEGLQLFTTLQRQGIPSRMINFPDEGHWVLKPANSAYWHQEIFTWLKRYAPPGGK